MTELTGLIKGLVQVRDGLTLIAFLSLVLLMAFRTQKVPELFFGLVRDKLTRQEFSALLRRFMILGFAAFLALVALAVLAQVLSHATQPGGLTIGDLRSELAKSEAAEEQKIHAEAQYQLAMEKLNGRDFDGAIQALEASIAAIPSLTAQEMLIFLYRQKGDLGSASNAWEAAEKTARKSGSAIALARLDNAGAPRAIPSAEGDHDLIGHSAPLPKGGEGFESAVKIPPGFYSCAGSSPCFGWWYTLYLGTGQTLEVKFRTPATGGLAGVSIYGTNGQGLKSAGDSPGTMRGNAGPGSSIYQCSWTAPASGWHFLRIGADPGTVYRLTIR